jgi:hypothetical protein
MKKKIPIKNKKSIRNNSKEEKIERKYEEKKRIADQIK